ncbi:hypothetical protein CIPAW_02G061300 [Carya illinoinensis]|uniref:Endonuclease/exonuclease/phosphatase domain-containing protein n=1 Tax=Carya illinoinensis TaxID=32201 RepID=A0A8T1RD52_CARIL|nr:hypothetical protein CIPAW_02G061300 [Carya illinoinensis]
MTVHDLHQMVQNKLPHFVFLIETKFRRNKIEKIKKQLQLDNSFVIDCKGIRGGLAFLWRDDVEAEVMSYTNNHISLLIKGGYERKDWIFTSFYGNLITVKRRESWKLLKALKPQGSIGCLCVGNFNEVLSNGEKCGGAVRPFTHIKTFRGAIEESGLTNMGFIGNNCTWSNGRQGKAFTKERIDRVFYNLKWSKGFPSSKLYTLLALSSYHCPLLITMDQFQCDLFRNAKPFRF